MILAFESFRKRSVSFAPGLNPSSAATVKTSPAGRAAEVASRPSTRSEKSGQGAARAICDPSVNVIAETAVSAPRGPDNVTDRRPFFAAGAAEGAWAWAETAETRMRTQRLRRVGIMLGLLCGA